MAVKKFLLRCSIVCLIAGTLGYIGLGPSADASVLGNYLYFDPAETAIHVLIGVILLAAYVLSQNELFQRSLVTIVGIFTLIATVYGFLNVGSPAPNIGWTNFENPLENLLHFAIALWAFWVVFMPEGPLFVSDEPSDKS